jgi:hypothetical protein
MPHQKNNFEATTKIDLPGRKRKQYAVLLGFYFFSVHHPKLAALAVPFVCKTIV